MANLLAQYHTAIYENPLIMLPGLGVIYMQKNKDGNHGNNVKEQETFYHIRTRFCSSVCELLKTLISEGGDFQFKYYINFDTIVFLLSDALQRTIMGIASGDHTWDEFTQALIKVQRRAKFLRWRSGKDRTGLKKISAFQNTTFAKRFPEDILAQITKTFIFMDGVKREDVSRGSKYPLCQIMTDSYKHKHSLA